MILNKAISVPSTRKAPGAKMNTNEPYISGKMTEPKIFPLPNNSRTDARSVSAIVKPRPIPIPSNIAMRGFDFDATASARPNTIQFTTIKGMNIPKLLSSDGRKALISN